MQPLRPGDRPKDFSRSVLYPLIYLVSTSLAGKSVIIIQSSHSSTCMHHLSLTAHPLNEKLGWFSHVKQPTSPSKCQMLDWSGGDVTSANNIVYLY
jgi:hypothetical protein